MPRPQPPSYAARKKPRCVFCRGFAFIYRRLSNAVALWVLQIWLKRRNKFWPSLNGLLNNKFSTWAAASSTICSRGRPKFLRRCARTIRTKEKAREPPALPASPWLRGGRRRAIAARWFLREIRRRTRVVDAFPDGQSALNLAAARLRHIAGTAWSTKRYLNIELLKDQEMRDTITA